MHVHFLDPYQDRNSPIHRLDPRVKFVLAVAFILTTSMIPTAVWPVFILLQAIILSVILLSQLGIGYVLKRAALAFPFVLAAFPLLFTVKGASLASFNLAGWQLAISQPGLERFASIAIKAWLSVQAAIVLASSTPFPELLAAMRSVKVPRMLVAIFGLMWRYMFVMVDEALRLMRARSARSGLADQAGLKSGRSVAWRARVTGGMAGSLFLRAIERSDRIYMAMLARGYDGEVRSIPLPTIATAHWLTLIAGLALLVILLFLAYLL